DERREIAGVAEIGVGLLLLLQDGHGDLGEVVEREVVDGPLFDEADGGFEPVAPEPLAVSDADHGRRTTHCSARLAMGVPPPSSGLPPPALMRSLPTRSPQRK